MKAIARKRKKITSLRPKIISHRGMATRPSGCHLLATSRALKSLFVFFCSDFKHRFSKQERLVCETKFHRDGACRERSEELSLGSSEEAEEFGVVGNNIPALTPRGHWPGGGSREQAGLGRGSQPSLGPRPETSPVKQSTTQPSHQLHQSRRSN